MCSIFRKAKKLLFNNWVYLFPLFVSLLAGLLLFIYSKQAPNLNKVLHNSLSFRDAAPWGQLGDFFGGILNPIISLFTLLIATMVWKLQKSELAVTQKALQEQAKTSEQQRQEQRFFDLLGLYQRTVDSITYVDRISDSVNSPAVLSIGKQAFSHWLGRVFPTEVEGFLRYGISDRQFYRPDATTYKLSEEMLIKTWNSCDAASQFDHYFRVVFRLLTESENLLKEQHFRYVKLLRAQLNRSELTILGLNIWLDEEGKKMIPLIAKYGLLKHLPNGHLRTQLANSIPHLIFGRKSA